MASDLESQSIQILAKESELQFESDDRNLDPERIFTSFQLPAGYRVDDSFSKDHCDGMPSKDEIRGGKHAEDSRKGLHFNSRSLDLSFFKLELSEQSRSKLAFPLLPGPKPSVLAMILRGKIEGSILPKKTSECNVWHNPRVPRVLVNYLLDRQLKKPDLLSQDFDLRPLKQVPRHNKFFRKLQVKKPRLLPPLRIVPLHGDKKCMNRSESSLY